MRNHGPEADMGGSLHRRVMHESNGCVPIFSGLDQ